MKDFYLKQTKANLDKLVEYYENEIEKLKSLQTIPSITPLEKYKFETQEFSFHKYVKNTYSGEFHVEGPTQKFTIKTVTARQYSDSFYVCVSSDDEIHAAIAADVEIHKTNDDIGSANAKVYAWFQNMLRTLGIPEKIRDEKSRARVQPYITNPVYYALSFPHDTAPNWSGFNVSQRKYKQILADQKRVKEEKARQDESARQKLVALAEICVEFGFDIQKVKDLSDALNMLREKDTFFNLGCAMLACRNDFSESRGVRDALSGFIENHYTRLYNEINSLCENYDGDGRVFRDCEFNYTYIFSELVDKKIMDCVNKHNLLDLL